MGINASLPGLTALLDWYRAMGADCAVGPSPENWLQRADRAPGQDFALVQEATPQGFEAGRQSASSAGSTFGAMGEPPPRERPALTGAPPVAPSPKPAPLAPSSAETAARSAASSASTLEALEAALKRFDGCGLKATAKNLCFYRGAARARLMIIGEAPGRDEDIEGKPFVGRAGQLLDKMLAAIGLGEADVHITNIVYWRPPGNRTPTPQEAQACRPFLARQMELVAPDVVVLLGGAAAKQILDTADGIMRLRGRWHELPVGARTVRAMATLHPAYLLRTSAAKKLAWRDLLLIKSELKPKQAAST